MFNATLDLQGERIEGEAKLLATVLGVSRSRAIAILRTAGSLRFLASLSRPELARIGGVNEAAARRLHAAFILGRLVAQPAPEHQPPRIMSPADTANLMSPRLSALLQEQFWTLALDTRNQVIDARMIYQGSCNTIQVRAAEILRPAVWLGGAAVILVHNHPSGDPAPSPEDVAVTRQVVEAGKVMDVSVLDHVIIGRASFVSLREKHLCGW